MTVYDGDNAGDSIQNIIGDIFSVGLGYILGTVFLAVEMWWLSLVWAALSEVSLLPPPLISHCGAGHLRPVHERQSADDHHHHLGPLRQAQDVAAGQAA